MLPSLLGLGAGDVVALPAVAYPTYDVGARLAGAEPFASDDPDRWPENTRLVWLNSPGNPHGHVLSAEELRRIVAWARERGAVVAADECYAELAWAEPYVSAGVPSLLAVGAPQERHAIVSRSARPGGSARICSMMVQRWSIMALSRPTRSCWSGKLRVREDRCSSWTGMLRALVAWGLSKPCVAAWPATVLAVWSTA